MNDSCRNLNSDGWQEASGSLSKNVATKLHKVHQTETGGSPIPQLLASLGAERATNGARREEWGSVKDAGGPT